MLWWGPEGIAAIEIKHLNGVIHCRRDRWRRDKYDNYGNMVERGVAIQDRGGRSPSRQVNEVADAPGKSSSPGMEYRDISSAS